MFFGICNSILTYLSIAYKLISCTKPFKWTHGMTSNSYKNIYLDQKIEPGPIKLYIFIKSSTFSALFTDISLSKHESRSIHGKTRHIWIYIKIEIDRAFELLSRVVPMTCDNENVRIRVCVLLDRSNGFEDGLRDWVAVIRLICLVI